MKEVDIVKEIMASLQSVFLEEGADLKVNFLSRKSVSECGGNKYIKKVDVSNKRKNNI